MNTETSYLHTMTLAQLSGLYGCTQRSSYNECLRDYLSQSIDLCKVSKCLIPADQWDGHTGIDELLQEFKVYGYCGKSSQNPE